MPNLQYVEFSLQNLKSQIFSFFFQNSFSKSGFGFPEGGVYGSPEFPTRSKKDNKTPEKGAGIEAGKKDFPILENEMICAHKIFGGVLYFVESTSNNSMGMKVEKSQPFFPIFWRKKMQEFLNLKNSCFNTLG